MWGRSPNAATAESTDLVANALAQMAIVPEKALMEWQGEQKGPLYAMCGMRCFAGPWPDDLEATPLPQPDASKEEDAVRLRNVFSVETADHCCRKYMEPAHILDMQILSNMCSFA